jgi:hypothetical protein
MARRSLLNEQWWHQTISMPDDEREIMKHYTLDQEDLFLIGRQNRDHNRLGLACVLACLRHPGRRRCHIISALTARALFVWA